jgi:glycosyltransferase involved in cell wall biosynthesis
MKPMRIDYLFTTFPVLSETFYQREIRALIDLGERPNIYSLWGGDKRFDHYPINLFPKWMLLKLAWWLPYWLIRKPSVMAGTLKNMFRSWPPSGLNFVETMLGLSFAIIQAKRFRLTDGQSAVIHAAWATAPGTAAQLIAALTGRKFCQGAHAYDIYRDGGDWWLDSKLADAAAVVTSTKAARDTLLARGVGDASIHLVRRGLNTMPELTEARSPRSPLRILSVGRLVEKKGYHRQLQIYSALKAADVAFEARIVGGGPLHGSLRSRLHMLGLDGSVALKGAQPYDETVMDYAWADVFLFTGVVTRTGDRDGLPNVVPEAMAAGVPVLSTPVGGVPEALEHGVSGLMLDILDTDEWVEALQRLSKDDLFFCRLRGAARAWVEREFDAKRNATRLLEVWRGVAQDQSGNRRGAA